MRNVVIRDDESWDARVTVAWKERESSVQQEILSINRSNFTSLASGMGNKCEKMNRAEAMIELVDGIRSSLFLSIQSVSHRV